jgi:hypothetical protein
MSYYLSESVTTIGRDAGNTIALPHDERASRYHAEIRREGSGYVLRDLNSKNGTMVNGQRISRHTLADGDRIRIGGSELPFRDGALLLPAGAATGGRRPSGSAPLAAPAGGVSPALWLVLGLLLIVLAGTALMLMSNRGTAPATPTPAIPANPEALARGWVEGHLDQITNELTACSSPRIPLEYAVLRDRVSERVSAYNVWAYQQEEKVTEGVYRVLAKISFSVTMVNPPNYSVTATYRITVDTNTQEPKQVSRIECFAYLAP